MNLLLKNNEGRDRRPHFVFCCCCLFFFFVAWSAVFVGGWVVVAWVRKSYLGPTEIPSSVYLVQFKDAGCRVRLRLHLFVFDVDPGNKYFM